MTVSARTFKRPDLPALLDFVSGIAATRAPWPGTAGFNAPAQALYESCGFERIGTCRTYLNKLT